MRKKAIDFAVMVANDNNFGYDQINRWGNPDFDCSGLVITAWENAGVPVRKFGATYTGNMKPAFLGAGFVDVTKQVDLASGKGLEPADTLLKIKTAGRNGHTAIYVGNGQIVQAQGNEKGRTTGGQPGDQTGKELYVRNYYNSPWDIVLRYPEQEDDEMKNPYDEPTKTYPSGVTFRGDDASWFIFELIRRGYNLIPTSNVAGQNTWAAIHTEQEKAGIPVGDADELTRRVLKGEGDMVRLEMVLKKTNAELNDCKKRLNDIMKIAGG